MSEKWETVGKSKTSKTNLKEKQNITGSKRNTASNSEVTVKTSGIQSIYTVYAPSVVTKDSKNPDQSKTSKPEVKKTLKKEAATPKLKTPVNLHEAAKMNLRVDDIKHLIESCQKKFPDSPLLWLRDLASYLNLKLINDDDSEPSLFDGMPLSALSQNMKKAIYGMVQGLPDSMKETYLDTCISNTAHDLSKNLGVYGWMIMTQVLTDIKPSLITSNLPRLNELRTSYQNRPHIGLMVLWCVGQSGKKDIHSGVRVWIDVMLPLITMKNYTKFVVEYLSAIFSKHQVTEKSVFTKPTMDLKDFHLVQDLVFGSSVQLNREYGRQLRDVYPQLRAFALNGFNNHEIFPSMMERVKDQNLPDQVIDSLDIMAHCLVASPAALVHWHKLYTSHLAESGQLLQYLCANWIKFKRAGTAEFKDTLGAFLNFNNSTAVHREEVGVCSDGCSVLLTKISRKQSSWFPWKTLSVCMFAMTVALVQYDVQKNGSFEQCHAGYALKDLGQYDNVYNGFIGVGRKLSDGSKWLEGSLILMYGHARTLGGPAIDTFTERVQDAGAFLYSKGEEAASAMKKICSFVYLRIMENQYPTIKKYVFSLMQTLQDTVKNVDWNTFTRIVKEKLNYSQDLLLNGVLWARQQIDQLVK